MGRYVTLGDGRRMPLGAYVAAWKATLAAPDGMRFKGRPSDPYDYCCSKAEVLRDFRYGLHDRINRHVPWYGGGRKWDSDWQRTMGLAAQSLNHPRLIIDWLPPDLKARFAYRLREHAA